MKRVFFILALAIACKGLHAQQRITGGYPINITDAPWQVYLSVGCGGSIIAPNVILTARHCVEYISPSLVQVYAGITCKSQISSNTFNVSNIILHPDSTVDAALLILSSNITFNSNRQPVNYFASVDNTFYNLGKTTRVSGWGWIIPGSPGSAPDCLQAVDLDIISNQDASDMLRPWGWRDLYAHEVSIEKSNVKNYLPVGHQQKTTI